MKRAQVQSAFCGVAAAALRGVAAPALAALAAALLAVALVRAGAPPPPAALEPGAESRDPSEVRLMIGHWCPFVCSDGGELEGFVTDMVRAILRKHGVRVTLVQATYSRAIEMVRRGQAGAVIASREDAPDLIYPETEQALTQNTFFVQVGKPWRYAGESSFAQLGRVGVVQSYDYVELGATIARHRDKIDEMAGDKVVRRSIQKLLAGRLDAFIYDNVVTEYELRRMGKSAEVVAAGGLRPSAVYAAFSPALPESALRAEQISRGTHELRASGELAAILARYGVSDWQRRD